MTKLMNNLLEQIKKITIKNAVGWLLLFVGVACWVVVFCSTPTAVNVDASIDATFMSFTKAEWLYMACMCVILIIGSICLWLGVKLNPEPFHKVLKEDDEDKPRTVVHNYSYDFAEICTQLDHQRTMQRVDKLIEQIEKEDKSNGI